MCILIRTQGIGAQGPTERGAATAVSLASTQLYQQGGATGSKAPKALISSGAAASVPEGQPLSGKGAAGAAGSKPLAARPLSTAAAVASKGSAGRSGHSSSSSSSDEEEDSSSDSESSGSGHEDKGGESSSSEEEEEEDGSPDGGQGEDSSDSESDADDESSSSDSDDEDDDDKAKPHRGGKRPLAPQDDHMHLTQIMQVWDAVTGTHYESILFVPDSPVLELRPILTLYFCRACYRLTCKCSCISRIPKPSRRRSRSRTRSVGEGAGLSACLARRRKEEGPAVC